jgi:hypothetical protein
MFMGNEDARERFRDARNQSQTLADLASAKAGVDQQARFPRFEVGAIAP